MLDKNSEEKENKIEEIPETEEISVIEETSEVADAPEKEETSETEEISEENKNTEEVSEEDKKPAETKQKRKKRVPVAVIVLGVWLAIITGVIIWFYGKANDYMIHYEDVYQSSLPVHAADDIFTHFESYDVDYIWDHISEVPSISRFESEDTVKTFIRNMIDGKEMTYRPSGKYSDSMPAYVVEADGFVVAEFTLCKDLQNPREFGFPRWHIKDITYYTESFETVYISAPANFNVYVNDVLLDEFYVCSDEVKPSDESYVAEYNTMPGIHDFYVADLYLEPEVRITDMYDQEVEVFYDESRDIYSTGYTDQHPEREEIEEFAINYTITFANVISRDERLQNLEPYFPEGSQLYDSISRNTALLYFMGHSSTTIENEEVREFIAYSEDVIYIEVYIEQHMTVGYNEIQVVPTNARIYLVRIDGEWKVASMRF